MANLKNIKKGDKVILRLFTGAFVGAKVVEKADAKQIGFTNVKGVKMIFDKATGKQISPKIRKKQRLLLLPRRHHPSLKPKKRL